MPKPRKKKPRCCDCRQPVARFGRCPECKRIGLIVRDLHGDGRSQAPLSDAEERERRMLLHRSRFLR